MAQSTPSSGSGRIPSARAFQKLIVDFTIKEREFLIIAMLGLIVAAIAQVNLQQAMIVGFLFAAYPVVANDSIQTIGTFIASNRDVDWWKKWLFIGGIFVVTVLVSWFLYDGDVSYERLSSKGFNETPTAFAYLQLAAPIILMMLTRLRIPVSTSLLILTAFATEASAIEKVVAKSLNGYIYAFIGAAILWAILTPVLEKAFTKPPSKYWRPVQWITTGVLWSFWWQQDAANIAIYLPRQLSIWYLLLFLGVIFFGIGALMKMGGEKIQKIVDEKTDIVDVRSATIIDALYAGILWYFKIKSKIPMSTTWVFLGLLGGRELMIAIRSKRKEDKSIKAALKVIAVDGGSALFGLIVSLIIGASIHGFYF